MLLLVFFSLCIYSYVVQKKIFFILLIFLFTRISKSEGILSKYEIILQM